MSDPKRVILSDTTIVRLDAGQVEVLRSHSKVAGIKMPLEGLARWRGWIKEVQRWLTT